MDINTASVIAHAINVNCEHYHAANLSHADWSAEQTRLWKLAELKGVASDVRRLVCPR